MANRPFIGDIGTAIIVNTKEDLTTATLIELKVKKPSGTEVVWPGTIYELTKIRYIIQEGDFNESGEYQIQAYVVFPAWEGLGETSKFMVFAKWE